MKKIVSMTNTVDNNKKSLRINYLCPTGAIPVFYDFSTTKKKNKIKKRVDRFQFMHRKCENLQARGKNISKVN